MTVSSSLFVASRYLLGRGKEGGRYLRGAALGIALSLVPIVVTLTVADGMIRGITDRYLELGTGHLQVYGRLAASDVAGQAETAAGVPSVIGAWPERQGLGIAVSSAGKAGATVRAVSPAFLSDPGTRRFLRVVEGEAAFSAPDDALVGEELARKIGARVGEKARLLSSRNSADGRAVPRLSTFTVRGIVSSGYRELDSLWFMIPWEAGLRSLGADSSRSFLTVKIADPYGGAAEAASALESVLGDDYSAYTWEELQSSQYASYRSTRRLLLLVMALVVLVAAVNVSSATSMLVVERRRDIAVLKGFGASPAGTTGIFVSGALMAGLAGSILGIAAGLAVAYNVNALITGAEGLLGAFARLGSFLSGSPSANAPRLLDPAYYLERIPVIVDGRALVAIGSLTVVCSAVAAWIPARRAGKLVPGEIFRKY